MGSKWYTLSLFQSWALGLAGAPRERRGDPPAAAVLSLLNEQCKRLACDLWMGLPVIRAHLWCAFLIMPGGHHVNARLGERNRLRDEEAVIQE